VEKLKLMHEDWDKTILFLGKEDYYYNNKQ